MPVVNSNVLKGGSLASTAATANQVIVTYTVPAGKTFFLTHFGLNAILTTFAATATAFGTASFQVNGVNLLTFSALGGAGTLTAPVHFEFDNPLPWQAGDVLSIVCTPSAVTPFTWGANIVGYLA
jgi:hypothetical protein